MSEASRICELIESEFETDHRTGLARMSLSLAREADERHTSLLWRDKGWAVGLTGLGVVAGLAVTGPLAAPLSAVALGVGGLAYSLWTSAETDIAAATLKNHLVDLGRLLNVPDADPGTEVRGVETYCELASDLEASDWLHRLVGDAGLTPEQRGIVVAAATMKQAADAAGPPGSNTPSTSPSLEATLEAVNNAFAVLASSDKALRKVARAGVQEIKQHVDSVGTEVREGRSRPPTNAPSPPEEAARRALARKRHQGRSHAIDEMTAVASATLQFLTLIDKDPARAKVYAKVGASIQPVASLAKSISAIAAGATVGGGVGAYAAAASAVLNLVSIWTTKSAGPSPEMKMLVEIRRDLRELRQEMHERFDRLERALLDHHRAVVTQLNAVATVIGDIRELVESVGEDLRFTIKEAEQQELEFGAARVERVYVLLRVMVQAKSLRVKRSLLGAIADHTMDFALNQANDPALVGTSTHFVNADPSIVRTPFYRLRRGGTASCGASLLHYGVPNLDTGAVTFVPGLQSHIKALDTAIAIIENTPGFTGSDEIARARLASMVCRDRLEQHIAVQVRALIATREGDASSTLTARWTSEVRAWQEQAMKALKEDQVWTSAGNRVFATSDFLAEAQAFHTKVVGGSSPGFTTVSDLETAFRHHVVLVPAREQRDEVSWQRAVKGTISVIGLLTAVPYNWLSEVYHSGHDVKFDWEWVPEPGRMQEERVHFGSSWELVASVRMVLLHNGNEVEERTVLALTPDKANLEHETRTRPLTFVGNRWTAVDLNDTDTLVCEVKFPDLRPLARAGLPAVDGLGAEPTPDNGQPAPLASISTDIHLLGTTLSWLLAGLSGEMLGLTSVLAGRSSPLFPFPRAVAETARFSDPLIKTIRGSLSDLAREASQGQRDLNDVHLDAVVELLDSHGAGTAAKRARGLPWADEERRLVTLIETRLTAEADELASLLGERLSSEGFSRTGTPWLALVAAEDLVRRTEAIQSR